MRTDAAAPVTVTLLAAWMDRVRSEYLEMPELTLTRCQMQRMWLLDPWLCDAVVDGLVASGFLRRRPDNSYGRVRNDV
jgi:hypothetical protein